MLKNVLYILCLFYLLTSCSNSPDPGFQKRESGNEIERIKLLDKKISAISLDDSFVEIVRYIKPETGPQSLISNFSKILLCGDTLFVLDKSMSQQCILTFNFDGKFLFKISARGKGPGEYLEISDFYVDTKSKHIGILNRGNVNKYNFNGNFIGKLNLQKYNIQSIDYRNNQLYAYKCPDCRTKKGFAFAAFDLDGKLLYEDYPERKDVLAYQYQKLNYFASNSGHTYLNLLNSDTIYEVKDKYLQPKFALDFGKIKLPDAEFEKLIAKGVDFAFDYFSKSSYPLFGLGQFFATDNYLWLVCSGYKASYTTIYSFKTKKTKKFNSHYPAKEILFPGNINSLNGDLFYGTLSTTAILKLDKRQDENDGILDPTKKFSQRRLDKYNFIKTLTPEDNGIIVLFKLKDF